MHFYKVLAVVGIAVVLLACLIQTSQCQNTGSGFGVPRPSPANVIFEPTLSFIRQNMRLINHYVALMRSIFVGAYDRPLITSTDSSVVKQPSVKVPPMDLPDQSQQPKSNKLF